MDTLLALVHLAVILGMFVAASAAVCLVAVLIDKTFS